MATPNYEIDYNDTRFTEVEADKQAALNEVDKTYGNMISQSDKYFDKQIQAVQGQANKQTEIQNQQTDFAIEQIEQQKEQTEKDYTKEQSGAYADWQKQSGAYGVKAEQVAAQGMQNSGFSESSQVSMYNAYQNRVATARETFSRAILNYDNAIKDARLQNNAKLAEIAFNALQQQLELSLQGFQYKNTLLLEQSNKKMQIDSEYNARYQDVLAQINQENALAEEVRQHNEQMAEEQRQFNENIALDREQFAWKKAQAAAKSSGGGGGGGGGNSGGTIKKGSNNNSGNTIKQKDGSGSGNDGNPTVDMKSVLNLGYGPISEKKLDSLVSSGVVEEYVSGNKIKFRNTPSTNKQKQLFSQGGR